MAPPFREQEERDQALPWDISVVSVLKVLNR